MGDAPLQATFAREVVAADALAAQHAVVQLARADGLRVLTVRTVRLLDPDDEPPRRYRVVLAVTAE